MIRGTGPMGGSQADRPWMVRPTGRGRGNGANRRGPGRLIQPIIITSTLIHYLIKPLA
jgi:hypothetical protein